jgi:signal recognition particle subunit SRP54
MGTHIILFDTAGRTHIDDKMMDEVEALQKLINPVETILVADAMTGQDAVNIAKSFKDRLALTGLILTRAEGNVRGGAAISMRYVTGCPIKFLGTGEHIDQFTPFNPRRIVDQILDRGDVVDFVERASKIVEEIDVEKTKKRMAKGKFDMYDMRKQLDLLLKMGGFSAVLETIPGAKKIAKHLDASSVNKLSDNSIRRQIAFIESMTKSERKNPDILNASRRRRISNGAGQTVADFNKFFKQYQTLKDVTKKMSRGKVGALKDFFGSGFGF